MSGTYRNDVAVKRRWLARILAEPTLGAERRPDPALRRRAPPMDLVDEVYGGRPALDAVEDEIFTRLPETARAGWTGRWLAAIPVGVDPRPALDALFEALLADPDHGLARLDGARGAAEGMAALYRRRREGEEPPRSDWLAARREADALGSETALGSAIWSAGYYALERHAAAGDRAAAADAEINARSVIYYAGAAMAGAARAAPESREALEGGEGYALWLGETLLREIARL